MGLMTGARALWHRRHSPEVWLLISNLLSRFLGFWVSLLISRQLGVQALGVYSSVLITTSSPTTPMSSVLSNNATMMTARLHGPASIWSVLKAQRLVFIGSLIVSSLGAWAMLRVSGLQAMANLPAGLLWMVGLGLILGQLLTQLVLGAYHGADRILSASRWVAGVTLVAIVLAAPLAWWAGLSGLMLQATAVALVPGVLLAWMAHARARHEVGAASAGSAVALEREAARLSWQAAPSLAATVVNNGTNWLACIYLVGLHHGQHGLGVVAISLQWMAVMLLPMTSWSGRVMRALTVAHQDGHGVFWREVVAQVRKCFLVSALASALVLVCVVPISFLYKVEVSALAGMFAINAVACSFAAVNFVYERVFYCLGQQRPWLMFSMLAYVGQLLLTYLVMPHSLLAVPLGNLSAIAVLMVTVTLYLRRIREVG